MSRAPGGERPQAALALVGGRVWPGVPGSAPTALDVAIDAGSIVAVGVDLAATMTFGDVVDVSGGMITPGLVNAHTHGAEILLRGGWAGAAPLYEWQWRQTYPGLRAYEPEDAYDASVAFALDSLLSGVTTVVENSNLSFSEAHSSASLEGFAATPLDVVFAPVVSCGPLPPSPLGPIMEAQAGRTTVEDTLLPLTHFERLLTTLERRSRELTDASVEVWPAPHKPNRTSQESMAWCQAWARDHGRRVSLPLNEVEAETVLDGGSAVEHLVRVGLIGPETLLGHCVHVTAAEMDMIADSGASVVHLPVANMYLSSGVAPVRSMASRGIDISLGTDNANCNDTASLLRSVQLAALLHRDPAGGPPLDPADAFVMATTAGARARGRPVDEGLVAPGQPASLVCWATDDPGLVPMHDPLRTLATQATERHVRHVVCRGVLAVRDGAIVDAAVPVAGPVLGRVQERSERVVARIGEPPAPGDDEC